MSNGGAKTLLVALVALAYLVVTNGEGRELLAQVGPKDSDHFIKSVWTTEEGLSQNTINAIVQTRDGYLWLGTYGGLTRFDGIKFTLFDTANTPPLKSNRITGLYEDRAGNLWIGSEFGGLTRYTQGTFSSYTKQDGLPSDMVGRVYEDREGNLWVATNMGLVLSKEGRLTIYTSKDGLSHDDILSIAEDREGNLWIGTRGGLTRFRAGSFTSYKMNNDLLAYHVNVIHQDQNGGLWVGTSSGLARFKDGALSIYTPNDGQSIARVNSMAEDQEGNLWIGTSRGLLRFSNGHLTRYTRKDGLLDEDITQVFVDREDNLWVGSVVGGLSRWREGNLFTYTTDDGLSHDIVRPIYEDREGSIWLGIKGGGLNRFKDGRFTTYTIQDGLPPNDVSSLAEDQQGYLWIGTWGGGLARLKEDRRHGDTATRGHGEDNVPASPRRPLAASLLAVTTYTTSNSDLSFNHVSALYADSQGALWIGTRRGMNRFKDGTFTVYQPSDGLAHEDVRFMGEDRQGALWIGTVGGLSRFKDGAFTNYTTQNGLSHNYVRAIYENGDGTLWIGTYGGGLNRFKDGRFTHYTKKEGLFDDVVSRVLEDDHGNFWMSGNRGIFRASRQELNDFAEGKIRSIACISYGVADGMKTSECNGGFQPAGWKARDGKLWFPTLKGLVVIDPNKINELPPPVAIEEVFIDKTPIDLWRTAPLPPGQGDLEIHYAGLSFVAPHKVRFKYKLEGYDKDWVDAGTRRVAYYTNIPPGEYRFRVIACNNDGVWNEAGTTYEFYVQPHFYQTYWFYALCALVLLLLGRGFHLLRVKHLVRRTQELESVVAERTAEVVEQKNQLAHTNEQLEQVNDQLAQANEDMLSIFNQWRTGVITTDPDGRVSFLSRAAERLFGRSQAEVIGRPWEQVIPLQGPALAQLKALTERPPEPRTKFPANLEGPDAKRYWVEIEVQDDPRDPGRKIFFLYDVSEVYDLRRLLDEKAKFHDLVGQSRVMLLVYQQIQDVARVDTAVLIQGETGTGKELVARAIHYASRRKNKPFIAVNCAGLTESLLGSQLFGHKRGAFTGAVADQIGVFEAADGGTLFLDEIGDIPMSVQTSLLRVLEEKEITRLGEAKPRKVNVRVIAATHQDLNQEVAAGRFRHDLLYRIRVAEIQLPPLRERREDLPLLVAWFLGQFRAATETPVEEVSQEVMQTLMAYAWPGNVRELRNAIESAAIRCQGAVIQVEDLPTSIVGSSVVGALPTDSDEVERQRILDALERTGGDRKAAARLLGIGRTTLYRRMTRLGIESE